MSTATRTPANGLPAASQVNQSAATAAQRQARPVDTLRDLLTRSKSQIAMALPRHMDADRLIRVALTTFQKTRELANCETMSVLQAVIESAQLGLEPDGVLGHAYLVPYKGKAKLIVGYKGYIALGYRSGQVASFAAHVVHENDRFAFEYGINEKLEHRPKLDGNRGKPVCVYAVARMKDGSYAFEVLGLDEVERLRNRSAMPNSPAWRDDWSAMAKKTAVRQLARWIPQSPELQRAAAKEEALEVGIDTDDAIDVTATATAERAEELKNKYRADNEEVDGDIEQPGLGV